MTILEHPEAQAILEDARLDVAQLEEAAGQLEPFLARDHAPAGAGCVEQQILVAEGGAHPVFASLADEAAKLGWRAWDAAAFVDECEKQRGTGSERETLLREAQLAEWRALFAWCWGKG